MVRAALDQRPIGQGPVAGACTCPRLPCGGVAADALPIVSTAGWFPDFAFLALIAWRLLRSDVWPAWWAAPLGLFNDLATGNPIGLSISVWTAAMLALDLSDRRTQWRGYWLEWVLAGLLLLGNEAAEWRVAQIMGASLPFPAYFLPSVISVLAFPVAAFFVSRIDRWRLGR